MKVDNLKISTPLKWLTDAFSKENSESKKSNQNRFDFLDAYRGSLALIVVIAHSQNGIDCPFLTSILHLSQKYSISGFFLLSSFLLTYRLLKDFHKPNSSILLCIIQYFIRRFFRVYLLFALFTWAAIEGPELFAGYGRYEDPVQILTLGYAGLNHLWTIAPEVKFYFLIPLTCLCFYALGDRLSPLLLIAASLWSLYDQIYNAFALKPDDIYSYSHQAYFLRNHFSVFWIGSQLAMAFFIAERSEWFMTWIKQDGVQSFMNYTSLFIAAYALIFHTEIGNKIIDYSYRSRPALFWSICLFMALLSESSTNFIVKFFTSCGILKSCGKFSFGMYLLHPAAIRIVFSFRFLVKLRLGFVLSVVLSYVLGFLSYYFIEKHLIKLANYLCAKLASLKIFKTETTEATASLV